MSVDRVRASCREDGGFAAVPPRPDTAVGVPAARRHSFGGDGPPTHDPCRRQTGKGSRHIREGGGTNSSGGEIDRARHRWRPCQISSPISGAFVRGPARPGHKRRRGADRFQQRPAEAVSQRDQLRGVLHKLGATAATPATILSDGAEGPRALGEAASPCPTHHVLDWFLLSMRIQDVDQAAKSWPDVSADDRQTGADLVGIIDRIRWRLWHGQVARALDLIGETLATLDGVANGGKLAAVAARKVARLLRDLDTYICGQSDIIIDYAMARHQDEPISTAVTESTVRWLLHRRMNAQRHMRRSPRGAHLMLKVRTATANGTLERDHAVAERWARRPFRRVA